MCVWDWGLNSGLWAYKAGALPLESHLQSILICELFSWAGLKPWSSLSQPPK
jgi:hypothetical protein